MRICALLLGLCAACVTTVRDYPMDREPDPAHALVAGFTGFDTVHVNQQGTGGHFHLKPSNREFLVSLPPGTYVLVGFDRYKPTDDRATFNARAGEAIYIGSFLKEKDGDGNIKVVVANRMSDVESALVKRYGAKVSKLTREIARSSVAPTEGDFAIKVYRSRTYYWAYGYWGAHHGHHGFHHGGHGGGHR